MRLPAMTAWLILSAGHYFLRSAVFAIAPIYFVQTVGMNPLELVLCGTLMEIAAFIFEVPTGVVADSYSRRRSVVLGLAIHGAAMLAMGLLPFTWAILFLWFVFGFGWTFISGAAEAWIADELQQQRLDHALFRGRQVALIGGFVGIGAGILIGARSVELAIVCGGAVMLLLALFLALVMPEEHFTPAGDADASHQDRMFSTFRTGLAEVRQRRVLMLLASAILVLGLASEGIDRLKEAHVLENIILPTWPTGEIVFWIGLVRGGGLLAGLLGTEVMRCFTQQGSTRTLGLWLTGATAVESLGVIGFALLGQYWIALGVFWVGQAARTGADTLYIVWVSRESDSRVRATVLSLCNQMESTGQIVGGPLVGVVGVLRSLRAALLTCGLVLIPAVGLFGRATTLAAQDDD